MLAGRKRENLLFELLEPGGMRGDMDGAGFNRCGLSGHAHNLVSTRIDGNGVDAVALKVLDQAKAGPFLLDEKGVVRSGVAPSVVLLKNSTLEIGILQTSSYNIENVDCLSARQQDDAAE